MKNFSYRLPGISRKQLFLHSIFWLAFITYEILLLESIRGNGSPINYLLHYALYVSFFYTHVLVVMAHSVDFPKIHMLRLVFGLLTESIIFYILNIAIAVILSRTEGSGMPDFFSSSSIATVVYRLIYCLGMATTYWVAQTTLDQQKKVHELEKIKLQNAIEREQLHTKNLQTELAFLKAQIVPHFLFNVLQKIYTQVIKHPQDARTNLMQFSELLQYQLSADEHSAKLPLYHELQYIKNYIRMRKGMNVLHLNFHLKEEDLKRSKQILFPPMTILTIIENVFQHGDLSQSEHPAEIDIRIIGQFFTLATSNKIPRYSTSGNQLGLSNITRRLEKLFPGRHSLKVQQNGSRYRLFLTLQICEDYD